MSKNFTVKPYPSLRAVVHQMVLRAPSGLSAKTLWEPAGYTNYNTMMSELSAQEKHKLGADMLLPLMDVCQSDAPVVFLARERGGVFIPLPQPAESGTELVQSLAYSIKEFGDFAAETARDISDGDIPVEQLARIEREGDEAIEAIMRMRKLARATHEEQYGRAKR